MNLYRLKAKSITFFVFFLLMQTLLFAQNIKKITIKKNDISLKEALFEVEKQSQMSVGYNESQLNASRRITLNIIKVTVEQAQIGRAHV